MSQQGRKTKRLLTAEQKYDLWVRMLSGQITQSQAAAEAGVDRSVVSRLRAVARDGAVAALGAEVRASLHVTGGSLSRRSAWRSSLDADWSAQPHSRSGALCERQPGAFGGHVAFHAGHGGDHGRDGAPAGRGGVDVRVEHHHRPGDPKPAAGLLGRGDTRIAQSDSLGRPSVGCGAAGWGAGAR